MVRSFRVIAGVALLALFVAPAPALAQAPQVGQLGGAVKDETGGVLPGAIVTLASEDRGFSRVLVTDDRGAFLFAAVPLGRYAVTVKMPNFMTVTAGNNLVEAERTTTIALVLKVAPIETVTSVVGQTPIVDAGNQTQETRLRVEEFARLALARNYQALIGLAPGVVGTGNVNSHGALSSNNIFMFDGVNTTDTTTGTFGASMNYDSIQEVVVRTSTTGVEFGRGTGAIVDIITKSGTNQFEGSFKYIATNDNWNAANKAVDEISGTSLARAKFDHVNPVYSATVGGPLVRSRLWFFAAYEDARNTSPERQTNGRDASLNQSYQQTTSAPYWSVRMNAQLAQTHNLWVKYATAPTDGFVIDYWGNSAELQALTSQRQNGRNIAMQYSGVIGSRLTASAMASVAPSAIDVVPFNTTNALEGGAPFLDLNDGRFYNGATFDGRVERPRRQIGGAIEYFTGFGSNSHAIKAGADWQHKKSVSYFRFPSNKVFYVFNFDPIARTYEPFAYEEYDDSPSESNGQELAFFVRDRFRVGSRLTIEAGIRFEHQTGRSDVGVSTVDAWVYAPRVSGSYAVSPDGRAVLVGSWGRFHDNILQGYSDEFAAVPQQRNYNSYAWDPLAGAYTFSFRDEQGPSSFVPDLGITPRYMDEMTVGYQQQIGPVVGVGVRAIARKWANFIDDVQWFNGDGSVTRVVQNVTDAERTYRGVELTIDRRFADNWSALVSYTYSRTRGNHFNNDFTALGDFVDAQCHQSVDAGLGDVNGLFPCSDVQSRLAGRPAFDRPHLGKFAGAYQMPFGAFSVTAGIVGLLSSKATYSKERTVSVLVPGTMDQATTLVYNYDGLGSERIAGMLFTADVAVEAMYRMGNRSEIGVKFEAFNVLGTETKTGVNNAAWCAAGGGDCDAIRSVFGTATSRASFAAPRTYRVSFAVRF